MSTDVAAQSGRGRAGLLTDQAGLDVVDRLQQTDDRGAYLTDVSRAVASFSHPARAVEVFAASLVAELVDIAQVVIRGHEGWLAAGRVRDQRLVDAHSYIVGRTQARVISHMMHTRLSEHWVLPPETPQRAEMLSHLFGSSELVGQVDALRAGFVLNIPLVARGRAFGLVTLAVGDGGAFDDNAVAFLEDVVQRIAVSLDACNVVADNRHTAATLRRSLLPAQLSRTARLDVASYSRVAHEDVTVGGDSIDLHGTDDDQTLLVCDAAGKGVAAAIAAKRIRSAVRTGSIVDRDPAWVLKLTNQVLVGEDDDSVESFATAVCTRLRRDAGRPDVVHASVVNAGHPPAVVLRRDGSRELLTSHGAALGVFDEVFYSPVEVDLGTDDLLLCYTDGVTETRGEHDMFGEERLLAALEGMGGAPASAVVERLALAISEFADDSHDRDDTAIVAVRVLAGVAPA